MPTREIPILSICLLLLAGTALADQPPLTESYATIATDQMASVFTRLDGLGDPLCNAYLFGGERVDATITMHVLLYDGTPAPNYPAEDLWLDSPDGGLIHMPDGTIADGPTGHDGITTFSGPLAAGGMCREIIVILNGDPLPQPPFDLHVNSVDLLVDGHLTLSDFVIFAGIYLDGIYDYRIDFFYDGIMNVQDLALMVAAMRAR